MSISQETTLQKHFDLCEEVYSLMIEENKLLKKKENDVPDEAFLKRKKDLLERLEASTTSLKQMNQEGGKLTAANKNLAQQALNQMMKIFFLDRQNEQLLLKANFKNNSMDKAKPVTTQRLKKLYQDNVSPVPKSEDVLSPNAPSSLFDPSA